MVDYPDFEYSIAYSYDSKNQVKIEQHIGTGVNNRIYYIYDESGNILKKKDKEYEYTDSRWGDLLTSYDGHSITYNDAGYPTQYPVKGVDSRLEWTYNGRLATVFPSNGGVYDYLYDSFGRRVAKNTNGSKFYYSGDTLVAETRAQGKYFEYMYDESGRPQGMYYYDGTKLNKYYFLLNLQGDVVQLRAQNNSLIAEYIYSAYGEILSIKDANGNDITDSNHIANVNPIRYRGYYYDTETGFYYLKSRYYDPNTGRFLSPDSQFNGGLLGYNLYAYCENNPVMRADPDGMFWNELKQVGQAIVGAAAVVGGIVGAAGVVVGTAAFTVGSGGAGAVAMPAAIAVAGEIITGAAAAATVGVATVAVGEIDENVSEYIGENGTQTSSTTTWNGKNKERIDVENPNPGQRDGQIHFHDSNNKKHLFDFAKNEFENITKSMKKTIYSQSFQNGLKKAFKILGETFKGG